MKRFSGIAAFALLAAGAAPTGGASAAEQFVIGVSNTHIGNSWREEFVCSIKAEALASGLVSKVILANREAGPSEQIADLRSMISAGVNAIIINPSDEKALNGVIKAAADKGIVVVAADQPVTAPEAYIVTGDQVTYAKVGAKWLFDQLKGKGDVYQMRGIDGAPGDGVRQTGFDAVLKDYPGIKIVATTFMDWSNEKAAQQMSAMLASGKHFDGVWTSGIDYTVIEAIKAAHKPFVPFVGADNNGFIKQLIDYKKDGLARRRRQQFAGDRRGRTCRCARCLAEKASRQGDDGPDRLVRQHDRRKRGETEGALRPGRRADGSDLRPREGLRSLHGRAGKGLQGSWRIAAAAAGGRSCPPALFPWIVLHSSGHARRYAGRCGPAQNERLDASA